MVLAFVLYFSLLTILGFIGFKKIKTTDDYILGSRSNGTFAGALSAEASDMSAWLFMGLPGSIYLAGTGQAWIAVGLFLGTVCNWVFIAKRLRQKSINSDNSVTLPEFFAKSMQNTSNKERILLRFIPALAILLFFTIYTASGFVAGGNFFSSILHTSYTTSLIITAAVILIYTFFGGFLAISWTSVVQGTLMLISVISVPITAFLVLGGVNAFFGPNPITENNPLFINNSSPVDIISALSWGLGYFGMPHILIKYMSIKSQKTVKKSGIVAITWCFLSLFFAVIIGIIGRYYITGLNSNNSENVFIDMINKLFVAGDAVHFPFLAGLFFCAILSAIMSTAASQLLMSSSSASVDIYRDIIKRHNKGKTGDINETNNDKKILWISRATVCIVAILAFIISIFPGNSIMSLVSDAWAGFGGTFGPAVLFILFWEKTKPKAIIAGMLIGALTILIWPLLPFVSILYSLLPAFILGSLTIYLFSVAIKY